MADALLGVQVVYAPPAPAPAAVVNLQVACGTTLGQALAMVEVAAALGATDPAQCRVGIWGKLKGLDTVLVEHDRVEIYRPLIADPMEARRRRADKKAAR
jgi:putative ubiquitin-RnfH superfamily antitoxin RatB of RatAB toxin-antitoxin module